MAIAVSLRRIQVFCRNASGFGNHLASYDGAQMALNGICPFSNGLPTSMLNLSTCKSGVIRLRNYSVASLTMGHFPLTEYKLHQRELLLSNHMIYPHGNSKKNSSLSYSTTSEPPEPLSEVEQPRRIKFKRLDKTAKNIMNILDKEAVEEVKTERDIPEIKPGYIISMKVEVPDNKRRVSTLKGIVIARRNAGLNTTFRLRRLVAGVGVESVFPLYSPNIKEVKVLDKKKVRRAKLYYLRERMNPLKN